MHNLRNLAKQDTDLLLVVISSLVLISLVVFTGGPLRVVLGLPFVLFFPGYTLVAVLYPRKGDLEGIERLALSLGLSLAVVPLLGLALNFSPWGIRLQPILSTLALFLLVMVISAIYRRHQLGAGERFSLSLNFSVTLPPFSWRESSLGDRLLGLGLVLAVVGAVGVLIYVIQTPRTGEQFTEFYVLGPEGKAENYPDFVIQGEPEVVRLGIINEEGQAIEYRVEVRIDGEVTNSLGSVSLEDKAKWEQDVSFIPRKAGQRQKVEFLLLIGQDTEPYRSLHLWIDVEAAR